MDLIGNSIIYKIFNTLKDIKDYLHLYLGCEVIDTYNSGKIGKLVGVSEGEALVKHNTVWGLTHNEVKPILRPLSDMTEEEFKEFAEPDCFASHDGYWYACYREIDPEFEGAVIEYINDACDDDPENVIMCSIRSKHISYGWIEYEEMYHGFGLKEEAEWVRFLLSKGFDLFGLIEAGMAIDKTKNLN